MNNSTCIAKQIIEYLKANHLVSYKFDLNDSHITNIINIIYCGYSTNIDLSTNIHTTDTITSDRATTYTFTV